MIPAHVEAEIRRLLDAGKSIHRTALLADVSRSTVQRVQRDHGGRDLARAIRSGSPQAIRQAALRYRPTTADVRCTKCRGRLTEIPCRLCTLHGEPPPPVEYVNAPFLPGDGPLFDTASISPPEPIFEEGG